MITPRLMTRAEWRKTMTCEACGVQVPAKPWPDGWSASGRSKVCIPADGESYSAHWCPSHKDGYPGWQNPTVREIGQIRRSLFPSDAPKVDGPIDKAVAGSNCRVWRLPDLATIDCGGLWGAEGEEMSAVAARLRRGRMNETFISVSDLRKLNAKRLKEEESVLIVVSKAQPQAAIIPFALYMAVQELRAAIGSKD